MIFGFFNSFIRFPLLPLVPSHALPLRRRLDGYPHGHRGGFVVHAGVGIHLRHQLLLSVISGVPQIRLLRLLLDIPSDDFCLAARLVKGSRIDMLVPPLFAAESACAVRALGLWETDNEQPPL